MTLFADKTIKSKRTPRVVAIVGPTASGKTEFSIDYALSNNGEIISADSRLVYKGFNIACAKPDKEEMKDVPHHMIDIVEPYEEYSAGLYAKEARKIIYDILQRGKLPIIVGGTGLYFRLLLENYDLPDAEPDFENRKILNQMTSDKLYEHLKQLDEAAAQIIDPEDKKKLIRAIEIIETTGKPLAQSRGIKSEEEFSVEWIGLNYPREELYNRINKRVDLMLQKGMLDETKHLLKKYGRIQNITSTIGYQEMLMYLDGVLTLDEALDKLKQNSRRYAKRQLTWFRKNDKIKWNVYPEILGK